MKKFFSYLRNHYSEINKIVLFILTAVFLLLVFPKEGKFKYEFTKSKPWMHEDLIAPFDFAILKSETEIEAEKNKVLSGIKPYFIYDTLVTNENRNKLIEEFKLKWNNTYTENRQALKQMTENQKLCLEVYDQIMMQGIIEMNTQFNSANENQNILLIKNNVVEEKKVSDFYTIQSADLFLHKILQNNSRIDRNLLIGVIENALFQNIRYDKEKTNAEQNLALSKISNAQGMVQSGERIISRGELITAENFQILESLRIEYESNLGSSFKYIGILLGQTILIVVSLISLYLFLFYFRLEIFTENKQVGLILFLIVAAVGIASIIIKLNPVYVYVVPICLIPIIIGVFTDTRLALFTHLITIIIIGFLVPNSYEYVFLQLFAGIVTILSTVKLERRSQFFLTSLMIFLVYSVIYLGMTLIKEGSLQDINYLYYGFFAGSALLTLFSYPIIFVFEKVFGLITNVTLLELSNTNNKLLRELALNAPGTFQHSMQMANLAEEAIHEIGGNPLLVRTGAMYHDIGKMNDPLYFVENQTTGLNPHDELTYDESAEIIIDHVLRGVEKAKKYKLPEQIIDFIRTHHGTRRTEYFYTLASRENPDEKIDDSIFTYPGPEPFSKETAVLMMADTVEAASRSLKKPDEDSIHKLVEGVIDKQMEAGQFNNADITLRDIRKIKNIFKKKLMNIYHLRIEYPK
ncbi:MAG: HDIG domain-containing protein [Bacteroidales bacterium]|nr:HDIG domain-containing protein [Bacteroidales bacterium]MCF8405086.1 HDIG domain-containing protein [Bacteroidales bacterium]